MNKIYKKRLKKVESKIRNNKYEFLLFLNIALNNTDRLENIKIDISSLTKYELKKYNKYSFKEKIFIILSEVNEKLLKNILIELEYNDIENITKYLYNNIDNIININIVNIILKEFLIIFKTQTFTKSKNSNNLKKIIFKTIGENNIIENIQNENKPFLFLEKIDEEIISKFIINEHPQSIAVVLSYLTAHKVSKILEFFPIDLSTKIIIRISKIDDISEDIIKTTSDILEVKLENLMSKTTSIDGIAVVSDILKNSSLNSSKDLLALIAQIDKNLSETIKNKMNRREAIFGFSS